jgi:glycosyltransferase involved in cell wall biosynthesis
MKTTCIIDSFNYSKFLVEAINSAKNQTVPFDEIVIVDDASTDDSAQILKEKFSEDPQITLVLKEKNEGQLSAFNEGFIASTGDVIFFLDSDDIYEPNYLEEALKVYNENKDCDFLFCGQQNIGDYAPKEDVSKPQDLVDKYGYSVVSVFYLRPYIGGPTSTLSMRRKILNKILPIPYLEDWVTRADDCLVYGASLAGAKKFFLNKKLVKYRLHGSNNIFNKDIDSKNYNYKRELNLDRLFYLMYEKMGYKVDLAELAHLEFQTIDSPSVADFLLYFKIIRLSKLSFSRKLRRLTTIVNYFFSSQKNLQASYQERVS